MLQTKLAIRNLRRNSRRTVTLLTTVALGIFALFMFDGFNYGIMNQYKNNTIHFKTGHGQLNTLGYREQIYEKPWDHWIDDAAPIMAKLSGIAGVTHLFPRLDFYGILTNGTINISARGTGVDGAKEADFFWTMSISEGETLRDQLDGILIGIGLARSLSVKVGSHLTLLANTINGSYNGIDVRVIGIFHSGMKDVDDSYFRIQRSEAARLLDTTKVESIAVGLANDDAWDEFAKEAIKIFPQLEATSFAVLDKVYYQHAVDWLSQQFFIIQMIILLIITMGITNSVSFTILERTLEIGNLRANGESAHDILALFLWEGAIIGVVGAALGIALAYFVNLVLIPNGLLMPPAPGLTRQFYVQIELQPHMILVTTGMGIAVTLLATLLAAGGKLKRPIGELLRHR